ncbi:hypothetical protein M378DRAFT_171800 [Amanita muscaria Koide BX008]|uniref:Uncharacterized protein n=1 Tax=Amanita muscaria (strain Koide BX008) TaxID=946122 RepID=A0A0C2W878_AMAMK|nr:hypothetical protein M378DRAFT_171800 [Amanita muscaria Koide BX008]
MSLRHSHECNSAAPSYVPFQALIQLQHGRRRDSRSHFPKLPERSEWRLPFS